MTSTTLEQLAPSVDAGQASRHLRLLHADAEGFLSIVLMRQKRVAWTFTPAQEALRPTGDLRAASEALGDACDGGWNVYTAVADFSHVPEKGRGTARDVLSIPGVWADIDVKPGVEGCFHTEAEALGYLATLPAPTLEIASGSGGRHVYWLFANGRLTARHGQVILDLWRDLLHARAGGYEIDTVQDTARVLRLAGTIRWPKPGEDRRPARVEIVKDNGPEYYYDQLKSLAEQDPVCTLRRTQRIAAQERYKQQRKEIAAALEHYGAHVVDTLKDLITRFNWRQDWAGLLEPDGWTLFADERGRHANCRYWTRPGKSADDGKSAATDYTTEQGYTSSQLTLYSEDPGLSDIVEAVTPRGRRVCSKYYYAKVRRFGGDEHALINTLARSSGGILP